MAAQSEDTIKALPLDCITIDPKFQMREEIDQEHVETLAAVLADKKDPHGDLPVVFEDGTANWLADGFHRWHAHKAAGIKEMQCLVKHGAFRDAQKFALSANTRHGKKRTHGDVAKAIKTVLADPEWSKLSQAAIADLCDCNHAWVSRIQGKLSTIDSQESNTPPEDVSDAQKQRWTEIVAAGGKPCLGRTDGRITPPTSAARPKPPQSKSGPTQRGRRSRRPSNKTPTPLATVGPGGVRRVQYPSPGFAGVLKKSNNASRSPFFPLSRLCGRGPG